MNVNCPFQSHLQITSLILMWSRGLDMIPYDLRNELSSEFVNQKYKNYTDEIDDEFILLPKQEEKN